MAYQLLGAQGYVLVAEADKAGVNPGSDELRALFDLAAPCLVLIDEWIAYVRQLYGVSGLPAGSFDANLTFAQSLTEAAKAVPHVLVVASLPASDIEIGGEGGKEALSRLRNTFAHLKSSWRPASAEEGYEIVRRLDTLKVGRNATKIAEEILMHLAGLPGAQVTITIEIEARIPEGAPDHAVRTVTENSRLLRFESFGFEEE